MPQDINLVRVENLPLTPNGSLKVELIPMPAGDDPWRTQGDYRREQRRDTIRFWLVVASLIVAIISTTSTAVIAVVTIRGAIG